MRLQAGRQRYSFTGECRVNSSRYCSLRCLCELCAQATNILRPSASWCLRQKQLHEFGVFFIDGWKAAIPLPVSASGRSDNKKLLHGWIFRQNLQNLQNFKSVKCGEEMGRHTLGAHRDAATESAASGQAVLISHDSDIHDSVEKNIHPLGYRPTSMAHSSGDLLRQRSA